MNQTWKIVIVVVLIISIIAVLTAKRNKSEPVTEATMDMAASAGEAAQPGLLINKDLPILLDLGSDQCIPCKEMAPILEELKAVYTGKFQVEIVDVRKDPMIATVYNIQLIPTQIFLDASGKELFRHEGFYSKEDILSKWKELGFEMTQTE